MKKLKNAILIAITVCALFCADAIFTSCGKYTLPRPAGVYVEQTTLTLKWNSIKYATNYVVKITDEVNSREETVSYNEFSLQSFAAGKYNLQVKAVEINGKYKDSDWSKTVVFQREKENGLTYVLSKDKKTYEVTGYNGVETEIVIPDTYRGKDVVSVAEGAFERKNTVTSIKLGAKIKSIGARAFGACELLESIVLPDGLMSIGNNAFQSCKKLEEIFIPYGVQKIPSDAFSYCSSLKNVVFPEELAEIGSNAFYRCALAEITLPSTTATISAHAFEECSELKKANLGGTKTIGEQAFKNCASLTSVVMSKVKTVNSYAFENCAEIESLTLTSVEEIGDGAFYDCGSLSAVDIGTSINGIGSVAFYGTSIWNNAENVVYIGTDDARYAVGCKNSALTGIYSNNTISDPNGLVWEPNVLGIANRAFMIYDPNTQLFSGHPSLRAVALSDTIVGIGERAFFGAKILQSLTVGTSTEKIGKYAFSLSGIMNIEFPSDGNGFSIKEINDYAFYGCANLTRINGSTKGLFPKTLERIGIRAFNNTSFLKSDTKGDGAVYFGGWAVGYVGSVTNLILDKDDLRGVADYAFYKNENVIAVSSVSTELKYIGRGAFSKCPNLAEAYFANASGLQKVGSYAFYHCEKLTSIELPSSLEEIGNSVFSGCKTLKTVSFAKNGEESRLKAISDHAFFNCVALGSIAVPNGVETIADSAFSGCAELKTVSFGDGIKSIGDRAFKNCVALGEITFGKNLESIGSRAFYGCNGLTAVRLSGKVKYIEDYAFYGCEKLKEITLNEGLVSIGKNAFAECKSLDNVVLPVSLEEIRSYAFRSCEKLSEITIGENVVSIGKHAFYNCKNLTIFVESETEPEGFEKLWNSSGRKVVWGYRKDN